METKCTIYLVDDEETFREGLSQLLKITGLNVESYCSAEDFLENFFPDNPGCLVLDIDMPGINGLELQKILNEKNVKIPIIFITGYGDVPKSVQALKGGAIDFLEKPFRKQALIELIKSAIEKDRVSRSNDSGKMDVMKRLKSLTTRRQDIMTLIVSGFSNKDIGEKLSISHRTVEVHRKKIMEKMKAGSLAELVNMANLCGMDIRKPK